TAGTVAVLGTLTVKEKTDRLATANTVITTLIIGGSVGDFDTGASASVNGNVTANVVKLFPGSTVSGIIEEKISADDVKTTKFYIENNLWMTAYVLSGDDSFIVDIGTGGNHIYVAASGYSPVIGEADFINWQKIVDDKKEFFGTVTKVGAVYAVYALIDYEVYDVTVQIAEGIDDVYIDGILMEYDNGYFVADVA
uniref:hypothetical protein n=1 Tax=Candidatus Methanarcanum hacksteinii TaxID=2911857 RepID=UPI0037DCB33B